MALSYNVCLCILLLYLVINITILSYSLSGVFLIIVSLSIIVAFVDIIFCGFFLSFGSYACAFFFIKDI